MKSFQHEFLFLFLLKKVVKARPKFDRMSGNVIKDQPLEVFGKWQTELYTPPPAENGKVNFSKLVISEITIIF